MVSPTERWQGRIFVGPSTINGLGLFASQDFGSGQVILRRDESREVTREKPLDSTKGEYDRHCDWLANGKVILLPFPERHLNHSCNNNAYINFVDGVGHITARRAISAGEEITNHYSLDSVGDGEWQCNCGSTRCLETVPADFFRLPIDCQKELLPLLADWFIEEHRDSYEELKGRL